ncbi:MAG: hypothetical protein ABIP79_12335 [Chitinophagaceae bacterium]
MNNRSKDILSISVAAIIVAFVIFAVMSWLFNEGKESSIRVAIAATVAGLVAPVLAKYFRKKNSST